MKVLFVYFMLGYLLGGAMMMIGYLAYYNPPVNLIRDAPTITYDFMQKACVYTYPDTMFYKECGCKK